MTKKAKAAPKQTKAALVREMLERPEGASLTAICAATGWQPHSARAAISMVRKAGYGIARSPAEGETTGSVYRITSRPEVEA